MTPTERVEYMAKYIAKEFNGQTFFNNYQATNWLEVRIKQALSLTRREALEECLVIAKGDEFLKYVGGDTVSEAICTAIETLLKEALADKESA